MMKANVVALLLFIALASAKGNSPSTQYPSTTSALTSSLKTS